MSVKSDPAVELAKEEARLRYDNEQLRAALLPLAGAGLRWRAAMEAAIGHAIEPAAMPHTMTEQGISLTDFDRAAAAIGRKYESWPKAMPGVSLDSLVYEWEQLRELVSALLKHANCRHECFLCDAARGVLRRPFSRPAALKKVLAKLK